MPRLCASGAILLSACFLLIPLARAETHVVLPFANLTENAGLDWIGESICEYVADALSAEGLLVLDRDDRREAYRRMSLRQYALLTRATVLKVGEALDANFVVFGQFSIDGDPEPAKRSIRLAARVLDLTRLRQSGEFTQTAPLEDLAALQVNLAWEAYRYLRPQSARAEAEFKKNRQTTRIDAMENYIRGLLATTEEQRHRFFALAARLDPNYSQPRFQLGRLHWESKSYQLAADWLKQVAATDPHFRQAMFLLGLSRYQLGDFAAAEEAFAGVARQVPLNEVFNDLGAAQVRRDRPEALENFRRALEGDESDPAYHFNVGYALWRQGEFDQAADSFRAALARNSDDPEATTMLGRCLKHARPRALDTHAGPGPRLKLNFDETAYLQLKEALEPKKQ
jgi:tetratricopeptide (TPR) repeat protein